MDTTSVISPNNIPEIHKNNGQLLDVHYYDNGGLHHLSEILNEDIARVSLLSRDEKIVIFDKLKEVIETKLSELYPTHTPNPGVTRKNIIMGNMFLVMNDFLRHDRTATSPNHDPTNNIYACDFLLLSYGILFNKTSNETIMNNFLEQIEDISNGPCAQGRCCRLIQFVGTFT